VGARLRPQYKRALFLADRLALLSHSQQNGVDGVRALQVSLAVMD
jgi:hypothetical protein